MKKISVIATTMMGAAVLCAAPISFHLSQNKGLSLSLDKALSCTHRMGCGVPRRGGPHCVSASGCCLSARRSVKVGQRKGVVTKALGRRLEKGCGSL